MKEFIITIDTEGDNLWEWREGNEITTKNVEYLQRFQNLCNQFGFKPVWLSNWEMITDDNFVSFIKNELKDGQCELGMHLHAWNTPPFYKLPSGELSGPPYLIEYPKKKNFPASVYKAAYGLVEFATNQFEENTKRIEELIRQREQNIALAAQLKDLLELAENKDSEWKDKVKKAEDSFAEDIIDTLNIVGKAKDDTTEEYKTGNLM